MNYNPKPEPTEIELNNAQLRLRRMDELSPRCSWEKQTCQCTIDELAARQRWFAIMKQQDEFEAKYY